MRWLKNHVDSLSHLPSHFSKNKTDSPLQPSQFISTFENQKTKYQSGDFIIFYESWDG